MVDELTRYYLRKQNLMQSDEFHQRMVESDIDELNKATIYMVSAPILASLLAFGYSKMRESGGSASHFAHAIAKAKNRFTPDRATGAKWSSKQKTEAERQLDMEETKKANESISDVYKQIKTEKKEAFEQKLAQSKERAQETIMKQRSIVRNMDPFERQRRALHR